MRNKVLRRHVKTISVLKYKIQTQTLKKFRTRQVKLSILPCNSKKGRSQAYLDELKAKFMKVYKF